MADIQEKVFKHYREQSRINWGAYFEKGQTVDRDQIQLGCLLRIADATESMSQNHVQMQGELTNTKANLDWYRNEYLKEKKLNSTLKGLITKLKKKQ